jgi:squalene synthase HpnC
MTTRSRSYTYPVPRASTGSATERASTLPAGIPEPQEILGRAAGENFRVASRLLPKESRAHLLAFYGFARLVDQLGDAYPGDRLAALDWLEAETNRALSDPGRPGLHPLVAPAAAAVRDLGADPVHLLHLIAANRQDQVVASYATFEDLTAYCRLSANPVGRLVLAAFQATTPERERWSDAICTGLQLAEHWQDVAEDAAAGRIYLPADDMDRFGVTARDLRARPPAAPSLRTLMVFQVARARRLLDEGAPLVGSLRGRPRWAVAGFWAGGQAALDAIAAHRFDPLSGAPHPTPARVARHLGAVLINATSTRGAA